MTYLILLTPKTDQRAIYTHTQTNANRTASRQRKNPKANVRRTAKQLRISMGGLLQESSKVWRPKVLWWTIEFYQEYRPRLMAVLRNCREVTPFTNTELRMLAALWFVAHEAADKVERDMTMQRFVLEEYRELMEDPEGQSTDILPPVVVLSVLTLPLVTPGIVVVDEAKASSSKNYTCIMAGDYTKALLQEHVDVIRKVLTRYPLFLAKREHRKQRSQNKRNGIRTQRKSTILSTSALRKVHLAWQCPANEDFLVTIVTNTPFLTLTDHTHAHTRTHTHTHTHTRTHTHTHSLSASIPRRLIS